MHRSADGVKCHHEQLQDEETVDQHATICRGYTHGCPPHPAACAPPPPPPPPPSPTPPPASPPLSPAPSASLSTSSQPAPTILPPSLYHTPLYQFSYFFSFSYV